MIKLKVDGSEVIYDTLNEAREAAAESGRGIEFWHEALEACVRDEGAWNDLLNNLWQSGAEDEAERVSQSFPETACRHWLLMALMLRDCDAWEGFLDELKRSGDESVRELVKCKGFIPWLKVVKADKYDLLLKLFGADGSRWEHWYLILSILRIPAREDDKNQPSIQAARFTQLVADAFDSPVEKGEELASFIESERCDFLGEKGRGEEVLSWREHSSASRVEGAIGEFKQGNFERAFTLATKCEFPEREILGILGACYDKGLGTMPNNSLAFKWHALAAENGNEESIAWLLDRAQGGMAEAQMRLGYLLERGQGICRNYAEAMKWYSSAAKQGCVEAKFRIGYMFDHAVGMWQEQPVQAFMWYKQAAENGDAEAQRNLGWMYEFGKGVEKNANIAQRWHKSAFDGFLASAESGVADAAVSLGSYYWRGEPGVCSEDQNISDEWYAKAFSLYRVQTEEGSALAWLHMANLLAGECCKDGELTADICYRKAAERRSSKALCRLGDNTVDCEKADDKNLRWYYESAKLGNEHAMFSLGCYFMHQGSDEQIEWFTKAHERYRSGSAAAIAGHYGSLYNAKKFIYGVGKQSDLELARKWYRIALSENPNDKYSAKQLEGLSC